METRGFAAAEREQGRARQEVPASRGHNLNGNIQNSGADGETRPR